MISDQIGDVMLREWIFMPLFYCMNLRFSLVISVGMITQFICNLLTSSNNHLLLQLCRWLELALEQATTKVATMVTYHHRHHHLWMNSSHSSWVVREQWRKQCASLRRTLLRLVSKIKGLNQINTAHSRTFKTPSLLSSKRQKNRSRWMSG